MKLCVIGAGVSGLCVIRRALEVNCEVIAFEQANEIGGTWVYREERGTAVHSSIYKDLTTDIPKEIMSYPDYPYTSPATTSYISADNVLNYLHNFAQHFDLHRHIKFERNVVRVRPVESRWEVIVRNLPENKHEIYSFDAVLVCTGNFHTPFRPAIVDDDLFKGKQFHSHDYRDAESFRGEQELVVGGE